MNTVTSRNDDADAPVVLPPPDPDDLGFQQPIAEVLAHFKAEFWSGPFPPPEIIERYEAVIPGAGKMMLENWRTQSEHRIYMERKVVDSDTSAQTRGQYMAFVIALGIIGLAVYLAYLGETGWGVGVAVTDLVWLAGTLVVGKRRQQADMRPKNELASRIDEGIAGGGQSPHPPNGSEE